MQWRKLARTKITSGRSRTRNMLCCGRRKENGRDVPDITASPGRAPPVPANRPKETPPMVIQGDFRKVSGISTEIFRQIEMVENDHDSTTAAALEAVERRGEMIVRILELRQCSRGILEAAKKFIALQDPKHSVQLVEIVKRPGQTLGLYIREGNGIDRNDGVFISRIALESAVYNSGCLKVGDEILAVNLVDVTRMSLDDVVIIMSIPRRLVLATRQRKGARGGPGSPGVQPRAEHKPPPVVVIKRELRDDENDDLDNSNHDSMRQRHIGDGREMTESRSRLGLGLTGYDARHTTTQDDRNNLDLYYNSRPQDTSNSNTWGYQPPPPVITEQPKSNIQHFQPFERQYPKTLESLAEKVHPFYTGPVMPTANRRMSTGASPLSGRLGARDASGYYSTSGRLMPRSGSDQHLPRVEYSDYTSISQVGRHSLLRSSLKSGSTLGRYNQRYGQGDTTQSVIAQKYGASSGLSGQYSAAATLVRGRSRPTLDYSSDTEATCGSRSNYYYYRNQSVPAHGTIPSLSRTNLTDLTTKFNSLPRDNRGSSTRLHMKRFADRTGVSLLQDDADGNVSAPEMPTLRRGGRYTSSPSVFTSDDYRSWLSRTPSTSAIYEQIRASRDVLNQQRAARFTYSAENIHDALKQTDRSYYGYNTRPGVTSTLDRHFTSRSTHQSAIPSRSLSSQHITSSLGLSSSRSPSVRRMRNLLDLEQNRMGSSLALASPGPVPTPSATLTRSHARQIDINPAEFLKYKLEKPMGSSPSTSGLSGLTSGNVASSGNLSSIGISGMLWVHLLAGRGLRSSTAGSAATTPVTPGSGTSPATGGTTQLRDLYCVLECDRVHKARTVVRTGDLVFDWDESFELDLVNNKELDLLIYSWDPQYRHKLCYKGSVHLESLLKTSPFHQLALKIEPKGTLYLRLRYTDSFTLFKRKNLPSLALSRSSNPPLFGVDLDTVVAREVKTGGVPGGVATTLAMANSLQVPLIVRRCVEEIERRGLDIIGLYRLCGSATKKRILREAFERNSRSVDLTPDNVPDINVITGVLKDYLRELPEPLFTKCLYQMIVDALGVCLPDDPEGNAKLMFSILDCLPRINRATLIFLMDHLAMVVSNADRNKMSAQNLAVAMAPPLTLHSTPDLSSQNELNYNQPINVLKYLLQIWPAPKTTQSGRRAKPLGPRSGDTRSALPAERLPQHTQVAALRGLHQPPPAAPSQAVPRSVQSVTRASSQAPAQSLPIQGQLPVNKGASYRPLSPRTGPINPQPAVPKSRQVIVSSPGSPSSSSGDSQSGSETIKHNIPSRVQSPNPRQSPSTHSLTRLPITTSTTFGRNSPSSSRLASPSYTRSQSPAMQASSAGMAVTLNGAGNYDTNGYQSTNPFLTGAYLTDSYDAKYNTIGAKADYPKYDYTNVFDTSKYNTLSTKPMDASRLFGDRAADVTSQFASKLFVDAKGYDGEGKSGASAVGASYADTYTTKYTSLFSNGNGKYNTIGTTNGSFRFDVLADKAGKGQYEGSGQKEEGFLSVEDTPTPTSSIGTEDSHTREVGEKDVEGDAEQSD